MKAARVVAALVASSLLSRAGRARATDCTTDCDTHSDPCNQCKSGCKCLACSACESDCECPYAPCAECTAHCECSTCQACTERCTCPSPCGACTKDCECTSCEDCTEGCHCNFAPCDSCTADCACSSCHACQSFCECRCGVAGDVDGDGKVNVVDVVSLINVILGYPHPQGESITLGCPIPGDSNCDTVLDVVDVVMLVNQILGNPQGLCHVLPGNAWMAGLTLEGTDEGGRAGFSVSYSADGTRVAYGAPGNDDALLVDAGQVQVFEYDSASKQWAQLGHSITGGAADDLLGTSVSMSADGSRVAIGAPGNGTGSWGYVRVLEYDESGNDWNKIGDDLGGVAAGDQAGTSVSISADGTRVAIGAPGNDGNGTNAGHVRVFEESSSGWEQLSSDIVGEAAGDQLGSAVSLSSDGTRVAVGAPFNDGNGTNAGHVRVFEHSSSSDWEQLSSDIDGEAAGDRSGFSVSLSSDGTRVAIGAPHNGGNGIDAGHVRVFDHSSGSDWEQSGADIDGGEAGDESGFSVSLSFDGTRVVVGAPGALDNTGQARVFHVNMPPAI